MTQLFKNNSFSTLASGIASGDLTLSVSVGDGSKFPSPTGSDYFDITLTQSGVETSWEVVRCTSRSGDVLTLSARGVDGTAAAAWAAGSKVEIRITAGFLNSSAKTDSAQTWTGTPRATPVTDNDLSFSMNAAIDFNCSPTAGGALTFTNITQGQRGSIYLTNSSNYAITAGAGTKVTSGLLAKISATGEYWLSYWSPDGSIVLVTAAGDFA